MMRSGAELPYIVKNMPLKVNFAGLSGDTRSMQMQGWEISLSCSEDHSNYGYVISMAMRHRGLNLMAYSSYLGLAMNSMENMVQYLGRVEFKLRACSEQINICTNDRDFGMSFRPVDFSRPEYAQITQLEMERHVSLKECVFFKTFNVESTIYVPEKEIWTIEGALAKIKEEQKDRQKELREKHRKKDLSNHSDMGGSGFTNINNTEEVKLQIVAV